LNAPLDTIYVILEAKTQEKMINVALKSG